MNTSKLLQNLSSNTNMFHNFITTNPLKPTEVWLRLIKQLRHLHQLHSQHQSLHLLRK